MRQLSLPAILLASLCILIGSTTFSQAATPDSVAKVGHAVDDFALKDLQGVSHSLGDMQRAPVVVAVFMGVECPLAKLYAPRLTELAAKYQGQGVVFLAIDSNAQDSLAEMTHFARTYRMKIPFLKDSGNAVADRFQAERTPEAFVLDINEKQRSSASLPTQLTSYSRARTSPSR
jgi:peroxiredoxin